MFRALWRRQRWESPAPARSHSGASASASLRHEPGPGRVMEGGSSISIRPVRALGVCIPDGVFTDTWLTGGVGGPACSHSWSSIMTVFIHHRSHPKRGSGSSGLFPAAPLDL